MVNFNENIIDISSTKPSGKYRIKLNNTNIIDGYITYVFEVFVYETDECFKVEIGPMNDYYDEMHIRHLCNNIPLGLDKKYVYTEMAKICSHVIPFIPSEYREEIEKTNKIDNLMNEIIKQDHFIDVLTKEELDLRSMRRALEVQRDSLTEYSEDKSKSLGGK